MYHWGFTEYALTEIWYNLSILGMGSIPPKNFIDINCHIKISPGVLGIEGMLRVFIYFTELFVELTLK